MGPDELGFLGMSSGALLAAYLLWAASSVGKGHRMGKPKRQAKPSQVQASTAPRAQR